MEAPFLQVTLLCILVVAAVTDLRSYRVPNWLTGSAVAIGVGGHATLLGLKGLLFSLEGLALGFALLFPLYLLGAFGGGDVKLLAAVGSFVGPLGVLWVACLAALVGGFYAVGLMVTHWGVYASLQHITTTFRDLVLRRTLSAGQAPGTPQLKMRYALAIGLGTVLAIM